MTRDESVVPGRQRREPIPAGRIRSSPRYGVVVLLKRAPELIQLATRLGRTEDALLDGRVDGIAKELDRERPNGGVGDGRAIVGSQGPSVPIGLPAESFGPTPRAIVDRYRQLRP